MSFLDNFKTIASNSDAFNNGLDFDLLSKSFDFIFIANSLHYCPIGEEQKLLEILKEHPYIWSII